MNKNNDKKTKTININYIARVEGEGALYVEIKDKKIEDVKLKIFEPPRFFEALLRGRDFQEAPDITARICGICPIAYQMSSVHAMENALGVQVDGQLGELRRLIYCGEWMESHLLHIYMLHAPDFLGFPDAIQMAEKHRSDVERGLRLKKTGNSIVSLMGGREIHPINVKVGGFYKVPDKKDFKQLEEDLKRAYDAAIETVRWVSKFDFPDFTQDYEFVSLVHPELYPLDNGRVQSNKGLDISAETFEDKIEEIHVPHSTALQARVRERGCYLTGPMARYALNYQNLTPTVKELAEEIGFPKACYNPYQSVIVRSLEVLWAIEEALRIIRQYEKPHAPAIAITPRASNGYAATEAPRGLLYHHYEIDDEGKIQLANIVPPTSQSQRQIEVDLAHYLEGIIEESQETLTEKSEQFIRNYDPCISCSAHFLKLDLQRT